MYTNCPTIYVVHPCDGILGIPPGKNFQTFKYDSLQILLLQRGVANLTTALNYLLLFGRRAVLIACLIKLINLG